MPLAEDMRLLKEKTAAYEQWWEDHPEPTEEEKQFIVTEGKQLEELSQRVEESKTFQAARAKYKALNNELKTPVDRPDFGAPERKDRDRDETIQSVGQKFVESDEYKNWIQSIAPAGGAPPNGIRLGDSPALGFKALVTGVSATSAGALVRRDYAGLVDFPFRELTLRDVITNGRTGSDLIEFPRVTGYTNNAAATAEATTTPTSFQQAGNGLKPQSSMALEKVTTSVKTIAHWIPVTRRALSDAPQIETLIDNFLRIGLELAMETEIMTGNGTGEHFLGLENTPNITLQSFVTDIKTTTRKALTAAKVVGRAQQVNAFVLNPYDWESLDLDQDAEDRYYFGGPMVLGQKRLWGKIVVESEAVYQGTGWTGDLKQAIVWDREQATIRMSDGVEDYFVRNLVAILAELRAAFGVFRPPAIVRMDLHAGANS
jgi:HK97 family phage major capsid protein